MEKSSQRFAGPVYHQPTNQHHGDGDTVQQSTKDIALNIIGKEALSETKKREG